MSDKLRQAAQMALEALDWFISKEMTVGQRYTNDGQQALDSFIALREAMAEQPVANEPLSIEQIIQWVESDEHNVITNDWQSHIDFVRTVEQAHGIGINDE